MDYEVFLFWSLCKDIESSHPLRSMRYSEAYDTAYIHYEDFLTSVFYDNNRPEYDCIVDYLKMYDATQEKVKVAEDITQHINLSVKHSGSTHDMLKAIIAKCEHLIKSDF